MSAHRYWIFISYAHEDAALARKIKNKLEKLRIKRRIAVLCRNPPSVASKQRVFLDKDDIVKDGRDLPEILKREIGASQKLVVICSPNAVKADSHVNLEVQEFIALGRAADIHPLIVGGTPNDVLGPQDCFPAPLRQKYDAEGTVIGPNNPLSPDFREDHDFRNEQEWANLLSGILGAERDLLYSAARRQRRRRQVVAAAAAVFAAAIISAGYWQFQRLALKERVAQRATAINHAKALAATDLPEAAKVVLSVWPTSADELPTNADEGLQILSDMVVNSKVVTLFNEQEISIGALAISSDGLAVIIGDENGMARTWNAKTGEKLATFDNHAAAIQSVMISPDGSKVLTGAEDGTVRLWDMFSGKELQVFEGPRGQIATGRFSSDGARVIIMVDGAERMWDLASDNEVWKSPQQSIFSPDGRMVMTVTDKGDVAIWNVASRKRLYRVRIPGAMTGTAAFSADGSRAIVFSSDNTGHILNIQKNSIEGVIPDIDVDNAKAYFPQRGPNVLIVGTANPEAARFVAVWDAVTAQELWREESGTLEDGVRTAVITADGSRVLTLSQNGKMQIRDAGTGMQTETFDRPNGEFEQAAISPDGSFVLTSGHGEARLLRSKDSLILTRIELADGEPRSVSMSPDGSHILAGFHDGARSFDAASGKEVKRFPDDAGVSSAVFSHNADMVLTSSYDNTARLWHVDTAKLLATFPHPIGVTSAVFSPDDRRVLTASLDGNVHLWSIDSPQTSITFKVAEESVSTAWFSHDGTRILTAGELPTITDGATGAPLETFVPDAPSPQNAVFSPDETMILLGSGHLIDTATKKLLRDFSNSELDMATNFDVSFVQNGKYIFTGSAGLQSATIWDVETGKRMMEFSVSGENESFFNASMSANGLRVVTAASEPPRLTVWDASSLRNVKSLLQYACMKLPFREGHPDTELVGSTAGFTDVTGTIRPCQDYEAPLLPSWRDQHGYPKPA